MELRPTEIPDVVEIVPIRRGDTRGWFSEVFKRSALAEAGIDIDWIQDNESYSTTLGVIRGLHYQLAPSAQDKLVRVLAGSMLDVAVDIRRSSPTFGHHVTRTLSAEAGNQLLVPAGFAHGFMTLEPIVHVAYKVSAPYAPETERAIRWDDPTLGIDWPDTGAAPLLSDKDAVAPRLADQPDLF
ncbi:MAG: dTDP-4-dehydrorhamnose 3,5-epimerase [Ilumatobacter sp.]